MNAAKIIVAALMLPALILTGLFAAVAWILRRRRRPSPKALGSRRERAGASWLWARSEPAQR